MNFLKKLFGFRNISAKQNSEKIVTLSDMPINQVGEVASNLLDINSRKFDSGPSKNQDHNGTKDQDPKLNSNETRDLKDQNIVPKDLITNDIPTNQIKLSNQQAKLELLTFEDEFERFILEKKKYKTPIKSSKKSEKDATKNIKENVVIKAGPSSSIENNSSELETGSEIHFISSDEDEQSVIKSQIIANDDRKARPSSIVPNDNQKAPETLIVTDDDQIAPEIPVFPDDDQNAPHISIGRCNDKKTLSDDEDSSGYNSSDFEFITQSEAELDGLVINYNKNMKNKCKTGSKTVEISRIDNPRVGRKVESVELRNRAGPSGLYPRKTTQINIINQINYPTNRVVNESAYAFLEGNYDPLPHTNYFLEQKSLSFNTTSRMQTENGVGFDMYAYVHRRDVAPVDDITSQEAESTKEMILSMYPQERPKRRRF